MDHDTRLAALERRLRRTQLALAALVLAGAGAVMAALGSQQPAPQTSAELRTRRLVVVDDKGVARVVIGQDAPDGARRSRAAGITLHDTTGAERGGFSTFEDGTVVMAMDAPTGVGAAMRDRLGLMVNAHGGSHVMLIDNETRGVVKLYSDGKGGGGVQHFKWDMEGKKIHVKTVGHDGEKSETMKMGG